MELQPTTELERPAPRHRALRGLGLARFLAPESLRPDLRLALRGAIALMAPLLLARTLGLPALDLVGIAAFLLTFGDVTGSEEPRQLARLAVATALGALAVASGVVAGAHVIPAVVGMFTWGVVVGLLGAYGNAGAAMGLPVAWAYLELGLTAPVHTPSHAVALAALYGCGGVWTVILASVINVIGPYGPLRERTAECYARLAAYLENTLHGHGHPWPADDAISPETRVRQAIASARLLAAQIRQRQQAPSEVGQRLVALVELGDQLFSLGAALGEVSTPDDSDALLVEAVHSIRDGISGRVNAAATLSLASRLEYLVGDEPVEHTNGLRGRLAGVLLTGFQLATGQALVPPAAVAEVPNLRDPWRLVEPLQACLSWNSIVLRHALRFGFLMAAAVVIQRLWDPPFGYWIPLTVSVVLTPYAGTTFRRGAQRLSGTIAGVAVGLVISGMVSSPAAQAVAMMSAFFLLLAVLPSNYGWAVFFLSAGIIPFEALMTGSADWQTGLFRIVNTGVGGALALVGGRLLWLPSEAQTLQPMLAATIHAMARYAGCVMGAFEAEADLEQAHRQAGLMNGNLQALFQRTMSELARSTNRFEACLLAVTISQRLLVSLNTLQIIGVRPELASADGKQFAVSAVRSLKNLGDALETNARPPPSEELDDALHALRGVMARNVAGSSLRPTLIARIGQQVVSLQAAAARLSMADEPA